MCVFVYKYLMLLNYFLKASFNYRKSPVWLMIWMSIRLWSPTVSKETAEHPFNFMLDEVEWGQLQFVKLAAFVLTSFVSQHVFKEARWPKPKWQRPIFGFDVSKKNWKKTQPPPRHEANSVTCFHHCHHLWFDCFGPFLLRPSVHQAADHIDLILLNHQMP